MTGIGNSSLRGTACPDFRESNLTTIATSERIKIASAAEKAFSAMTAVFKICRW